MERIGMRKYIGAVALAAVALSVVLVGVAAAKPPAPPATNGGCPTGTTGLPTASNVGAASSGTVTRAYTLSSWANENPVNGVPGLVGYCVYVDKTATAVSASYPGWKASKVTSKEVAFIRPGGDKTNVPLDGTTDIAIGSATFSASPTTQTIVLHINDAATCQALYPGSTDLTCFVLPGQKPGPVCDAAAAGDSNAAYNNIPKDVLDCNPPSQAFQAQSTSEFGDEVLLNTTSGHITSLTVEFQSWGCSVSGHWEQGATNPCVTTPGATFTHPITANIYGKSTAGTPGALLANGTVT